MKHAKMPFGSGDGRVVYSPGAKLSTGPLKPKKKSPFNNTLKKKNGIYKYISKLISRGRAQARAYARAGGCQVAESVAAEEAAKAFGGKASDLYLWEGAAFALGLDAFLEVFYQQRSENAADGAPRDVRRAFQAKINRELAARCREDADGATGNGGRGAPALPVGPGTTTAAAGKGDWA